ncbi:hypothetical protein MPTK1_1g00500 [Marchantia polymorpha subsp. ruderalis]|uniref:Uncharacterized protein n=2 Tax=Marchantia polymorpha TaxID=3197 RepID=A0AAF6AJZ2_MARPO|nr:hypothetical protein MARPO_0103s0037 [Marchantia polymorpha]BBM96762.1 hypothetical protein Mp_1g00500 [Marchantia polymorpha subsp. ruderalis]|eukprot:PTQ32066.1 hypothetical protein MARPO_0103s0037 [Marchantia polymorpha]
MLHLRIETCILGFDCHVRRHAPLEVRQRWIAQHGFLSSTVSGRNRVAMETWLLQESPGVGGLVGELGWLGFVTSETRPTRRNLKFSCNWILGGR